MLDPHHWSLHQHETWWHTNLERTTTPMAGSLSCTVQPTMDGKYVYLDQGGELFNHPEVRNLFRKKGYNILPTGADNSHQNGPVEWGPCTLANTIRTLLVDANLDIKFWPYAFYHALRMSDAFLEWGASASPVKLATGKSKNFLNIWTFGCQVWVLPPGAQTAKLKPNSQKGIFLG